MSVRIKYVPLSGEFVLTDHAPTHIRAGGDEIDGDKLDIDWNPTNYVPTTSPAEADHGDNLTAHLAGIDAYLGVVGNVVSGSVIPHALGGGKHIADTLADLNSKISDADLISEDTFNDHNARHESGGADAIKLDDLASTDDNTDLNASTSAHGLLPKLSNVSSQFLDGSGNWSVPAGGITFTDIDGYELTSVVDGKLDLKADKTTLDSYQVVGPYITFTDIDGYAEKTLLDSYATLTAFNDHNARHESGGADAIKLDDLSAPDDNTDLNASTSAHGLLPKLDNNASNFLNGQGNWAAPAGGGGTGLDGYLGTYFNWTSGGVTTTMSSAGVDYRMQMQTRFITLFSQNISAATTGVITFDADGLYCVRATFYHSMPSSGYNLIRFYTTDDGYNSQIAILDPSYITSNVTTCEWWVEAAASSKGTFTVRRDSDSTFVLYNAAISVTKIN